MRRQLGQRERWKGIKSNDNGNSGAKPLLSVWPTKIVGRLENSGQTNVEAGPRTDGVAFRSLVSNARNAPRAIGEEKEEKEKNLLLPERSDRTPGS